MTRRTRVVMLCVIGSEQASHPSGLLQSSDEAHVTEGEDNNGNDAADERPRDAVTVLKRCVRVQRSNSDRVTLTMCRTLFHVDVISPKSGQIE